MFEIMVDQCAGKIIELRAITDGEDWSLNQPHSCQQRSLSLVQYFDPVSGLACQLVFPQCIPKK